jgi:hypothetical protein
VNTVGPIYTPLTYWSQTMSLGEGPTSIQVGQAMCWDWAHVYGTNPLTESAEHLAAAYYGWTFRGTDPVNSFDAQGCPAH